MRDGLPERCGSKPTFIESSDDLSSLKGQTSAAFTNDAPAPIEVSIAEGPEAEGRIIRLFRHIGNASRIWSFLLSCSLIIYLGGELPLCLHWL